MHYQKKKNDTKRVYIYPDKGETLKDILIAIAMASFKLARSVGMSAIYDDLSKEMSREDADSYIKDGKLSMDYVEFRRCKTNVFTQGDHLVLDAYTFEKDRGPVEQIFERANRILKGKDPDKEPVTKAKISSYEGEFLDLQLREFSITREDGESDFDLRKRAFPNVWEKDKDRALEILFGMDVSKWSGMIQAMAESLTKRNPKRQELIRFAQKVSDFSKI